MTRLRPFFIAADERRFPVMIRSKTFRQQLKNALKEALNVFKVTPPLRLLPDLNRKNVAAGYTDASLEKDAMGKERAVIAGMFLLCRGDGSVSWNLRYSFSSVIENPEYGIAVWEGVALLVAIRRFPKGLGGHFRLSFGIDNSNILYGISKASSGSLALAPVAG